MDVYAIGMLLIALSCAYAAWAAPRVGAEMRDAWLLAGTAAALGTGGGVLSVL